jgi:hypothetical protein
MLWQIPLALLWEERRGPAHCCQVVLHSASVNTWGERASWLWLSNIGSGSLGSLQGWDTGCLVAWHMAYSDTRGVGLASWALDSSESPDPLLGFPDTTPMSPLASKVTWKTSSHTWSPQISHGPKDAHYHPVRMKVPPPSLLWHHSWGTEALHHNSHSTFARKKEAGVTVFSAVFGWNCYCLAQVSLSWSLG